MADTGKLTVFLGNTRIVVPEPTTIVLVGIGAACAAWAARRRRA